MWIERVIARAFGPLVDQTLELAPGMTVVGGPNEAGKTSWHAATRLAITGVRRGPGRTRESTAVEERHRPWDQPDRWEVEARLHLDDGRTIDISQDLAGKVACRALDIVLAEDVSSEIMDGTPDASRWLGLDRDSFATTVSVNQAQILAVADNAAALQEQMQRAAATRGTDATAAEAIERLKAFRKEAVGADTVVAKGPLRAAMRELDAADALLVEARRRHAAYLDRSAQLEEAEQQLAAAQRQAAILEAAAARRLTDETRLRADRAAELSTRHPTRPAALQARDELADQVAAALAAWQRRQAPVALEGPSSLALGERLAQLPETPAGDRRPAAEVQAALRGLDLAEEAVRLHAEPPQPAAVAPDIARGAPSPFIPAVAAGLAALSGVVALSTGQSLAGVALLLVAVGLASLAWRQGEAARRAAAGASASGAFQAQLAAGWEAQQDQLTAAAEAAGEALRAALRDRGAPADGDPRTAMATYEAACLEREQQVQAAAGREALQQAFAAQLALEESAAHGQRAAAETEAGLRAVATQVGATADGVAPQLLVERLVAWRGERAAEARAREQAILEWQELQGLLARGTLADLQAEAAQRAEAASRLSGSLPSGATLPMGDLGAAAEEAGRAMVQARQGVDALTGELRVLKADLPEVAEAEERVDAARRERERVRELAEVIDQTLVLLEAAERRVHRDLAPVLAASIQRWLPKVSGGAYLEAGVNPRDLSVEVKEARSGQWREARLLSEGTREQIYLLLRVAMAEHLVSTDETAPLLLDEVTVQSDGVRKRELLGVLQALSTDRQVILFTHDDDVINWATAALDPTRDKLVRLAGW